MTITIRQATADDAPTLAALSITVQTLHHNAMPERYKPLAADDPQLIGFFADRLADPDDRIDIAFDAMQPVGYTMCEIKHRADHVFVYGGTDYHVDQISVIESHQGCGIGQQLMALVMQNAHAIGADYVTLGVVSFNQHAIRFYENLGFSVRTQRMWKALNPDD